MPLQLNIPSVKPEHLKRMADGFQETVRSRIDELGTATDPNNVQARKFFEYLLEQVDADRFDAVRTQFLSDISTADNVNMLKYLDPVTWFESKLSICRWLKLHTRAPMRILDLGTGPGHFAVVARFFGHSVVGTDLPHRSKGVDDTGHLYDALCDLYRVERISHMIRPFESLGDMSGRYDLVTAFLAAFNIDENKQPWTRDHWKFFLSDLVATVLRPESSLFMRLAHDKLTDNAWSYLVSHATWKEDQSRQIYITDFSTLS